MLNILTEPSLRFYQSGGVLRKASLPEGLRHVDGR